MSAETTASVGALLKEYRRAAGLTQEALAPPLVISPSAAEQAAEVGATAVTASKLLEAKRKRRGG